MRPFLPKILTAASGVHSAGKSSFVPSNPEKTFSIA
jgi:hypothetical protein